MNPCGALPDHFTAMLSKLQAFVLVFFDGRRVFECLKKQPLEQHLTNHSPCLCTLTLINFTLKYVST